MLSTKSQSELADDRKGSRKRHWVNGICAQQKTQTQRGDPCAAQRSVRIPAIQNPLRQECSCHHRRNIHEMEGEIAEPDSNRQKARKEKDLKIPRVLKHSHTTVTQRSVVGFNDRWPPGRHYVRRHSAGQRPADVNAAQRAALIKRQALANDRRD